MAPNFSYQVVAAAKVGEVANTATLTGAEHSAGKRATSEIFGRGVRIIQYMTLPLTLCFRFVSFQVYFKKILPRLHHSTPTSTQFFRDFIIQRLLQNKSILFFPLALESAPSGGFCRRVSNQKKATVQVSL
jgi:hypothetical protein